MYDVYGEHNVRDLYDNMSNVANIIIITVPDFLIFR